jgi:hypothetical protein
MEINGFRGLWSQYQQQYYLGNKALMILVQEKRYMQEVLVLQGP